MPSGLMPTYAYRPARKSADTSLRTTSALRARLFGGGTYFRSRDVGLQSNRISVQVIQYEAPDSAQPDAVCVVTNYNLNIPEMVTGLQDLEVFDIQLSATDRLEIDQLDTPTPRARNYSISFKIAPPPEVPVELGTTSVVKLFGAPGKLAARVPPPLPVFTPASKIIITRRRRVYRLAPISVTDPDTMAVTWGWDIADLRSQINANDPWIEMLERSGPIDDGMGGSAPNPNPLDVKDTGVDAEFLSPFAETFLSGGNGLPTSPDRENTGPTRSIVHVDQTEEYNGELKELNVVYEWQGRSSADGAWKVY